MMAAKTKKKKNTNTKTKQLLFYRVFPVFDFSQQGFANFYITKD